MISNINSIDGYMFTSKISPTRNCSTKLKIISIRNILIIYQNTSNRVRPIARSSVLIAKVAYLWSGLANKRKLITFYLIRSFRGSSDEYRKVLKNEFSIGFS